MNKICHLSSHHSPFSIRIFKKQCSSLAKAGFKVHYVVPGNGRKDVSGVEFHYVKKRNDLFGRAISNPYRTYLAAKNLNAKLYHFHDPELIFYAFLLKLRGKIVIYDIHEDLPAKIKDSNLKKIPLIRNLVAWLADKLEKFFANKFDYNITVNENIAQKFPSKKTQIITNYPILNLLGNPEKTINNNPPIVVYAGLLTRIRGIKEMVEAMAIVKSRAQLLLLGSWRSKAYKEECMQSEGWKYCTYKGQLPLEDAYMMVKKSDIGIINFLPLENHLHSMPNKAFEYMAAGLPMVMSNFTFWEKLFSECALFSDPNNPKQLSEKIIAFATNDALRREMGLVSRKLIDDKYSWEKESEKLIDLYRSVLK